MAKQCLFCPNPVDSAEHLWSDWILKDLKPSEPIQIKIGKALAKVVDSPEVRMRCVCKKCNNGWMNDIEQENMPHMLAIMNDKPALLTPVQQKVLTRWAILKAMVLDGSSKRRTPFYTESERLGMRPPLRSFPVGTRSWIGRLSIKGFHAGLTDTFGQIDNIPKAYRGCVTTIIVGHLVIHLTMHVLPLFATRPVRLDSKPGAWDKNLLEVWPVFGDKHWPPRCTFALGGTSHHIGALVNRFKIGTDITG